MHLFILIMLTVGIVSRINMTVTETHVVLRRRQAIFITTPIIMVIAVVYNFI